MFDETSRSHTDDDSTRHIHRGHRPPEEKTVEFSLFGAKLTTEVTASRLEFADGKDASGNTPIPFPEADADGFQHIPDGY